MERGADPRSCSSTNALLSSGNLSQTSFPLAMSISRRQPPTWGWLNFGRLRYPPPSRPRAYCGTISTIQLILPSNRSADEWLHIVQVFPLPTQFGEFYSLAPLRMLLRLEPVTRAHLGHHVCHSTGLLPVTSYVRLLRVGRPPTLPPPDLRCSLPGRQANCASNPQEVRGVIFRPYAHQRNRCSQGSKRLVQCPHGPLAVTNTERNRGGVDEGYN